MLKSKDSDLFGAFLLAFATQAVVRKNSIDEGAPLFHVWIPTFGCVECVLEMLLETLVLKYSSLNGRLASSFELKFLFFEK